MNQKEFRSCSGQEFRAVNNEQGEQIIEGHAAVFNRKTNVAGVFYEMIDSGAFDQSDLRDVPLMINHDFSKVPLARSRRNNGNSTLTLTVDDIGLAIRAKLDTENNVEARALYSAVERGDISGMSFAFTVDAEEWQDLNEEIPTRIIKSISKVYEVSACNFAQYEDTDIYARAAITLDSARKVLENARRQSADTDNEIEIYRLKNMIWGGI